jgi:hypothetical protein
MKQLFMCLSALLVLASNATAQVIWDGASTAAEGYQRGLSGVISAQGQRNVSNSQAAINLTDARSSQIDNQLKSVNAYWEKNAIYNEHLQQKLTQIDQRRQFYLQRHGLKPLTPEQFDRTTGQIIWPKIMDQKAYDQYRKKIDELFHKRSYEGALTGDEYMVATTTLNAWHQAIVKQKKEYPGPIVDQMLMFLLSVKHELDNNLS